VTLLVTLVLVTLVVLHNVDGDEITINVDQIVALKRTGESRGDTNRVMSPGIRCVIDLADRKIVSVVEDCETVSRAIRQAEDR
jgi:hypothetical protein